MNLRRRLFGSVAVGLLLAVSVMVVEVSTADDVRSSRLASCCFDRVGDANGLGGDEPTIGDVSAMIDSKFISGDPGAIACVAEADINLSGGDDPQFGDVTIGDISHLIDYLFITGPSLGLPACVDPSPCLDCHGGVDNQSGAPPRGLRGEMAPATKAVGAHTRHMEGGSISSAIACGECHIVPEAPGDPGHEGVDSIAELTFGPLAGTASFWDRETETCAQVYCHGNFPGGHTDNTPQWTATGEAECGACHEVGPTPVLLGGRHQVHAAAHIECYECHFATNDTHLHIADRGLHVNGQVEVSFSSGVGSYAGGWCSSPACHSSAPW